MSDLLVDNSFVHIPADNRRFFLTLSFISKVMSFWGIRAGGGRRLRPPLRRSAAMFKCELMGSMVGGGGPGGAHAFHGGHF
jgi:hypothetical protein